ncbi:alpha/beta hydrolase [Gemmata sp.]|uniref:alpha/beta hydrolase n=1 Tax=Gemmata sp. TaxID=1914242 RepID=UPI003F7223E9
MAGRTLPTGLTALAVAYIAATGGAARAADKPPAPTHADVKYGPHPRQVLHFWKAKADAPTPVVVFFHGGSWMKGDRMEVDRRGLLALLDDGVSVVSVEYRLISDARRADVEPPVQWPLEDAARSVQFVRSRAKDWGLDRSRVGVSGVSAGACSALWVALRDDLADPASADPVARESTRVACAAVFDAQTTLDPQLTRAWIPNATYGPHAFGRFGGDPKGAFEGFLKARDELLPAIKRYSPLEWAGAGDPPVFCAYATRIRPAGEAQRDPTHSPVFGVKLKEKLDAVKVPCEVRYPGGPGTGHASARDFLKAVLTATAAPK